MVEGWKPLANHHYKVQELAEEWNCSDDFIVDLFEEEPGVVVFYKPKPGKRPYKPRRIPADVALRVYRRHQQQ